MRITSRYIAENTTIGIVDFDNYLEDHDILNSETEFNQKINEILSKMVDESTSYCLVRFYGGWYMDGTLSRIGSLIQQRIATNRIFPLNKGGKNYHGQIELASSISILEGFTFENTYRIKNGLPNIRLDKQHLNSHCSNSNDSCPARILDKFTRRKDKECATNHCTVINQDAYKYSDQKMVDTMMALDIVDYGQNQNVNKIVLFSDDTDLVPSVLRSKIKDNKIKVVASQSSAIDMYTDLENHFSTTLLIP